MTRILIIDDSAFQRRIIRGLLTAEGYDVREACNGSEGLALADDEIDGVLLDLIMPEMDGFAVLEALQRERPDLPAVVLSADIQDATRQQCLALGARGFLNKPPQRDRLLASVREMLGA